MVMIRNMKGVSQSASKVGLNLINEDHLDHGVDDQKYEYHLKDDL